MARTRPPNPKRETLRRSGSLNPRPDDVRDPLFASCDFLDAHDLIQVKYEMLRRVRIDGEVITRSAMAFGFSRPSYYQIQAAFERGGLPALLPKKRGPQRAHKLSKEVVDFLQQTLSDDPSLRPASLALRVEGRFGIQVHPRSVERALARRKKKLPRRPARKEPTAPPKPAPRRTRSSAARR